MNRIFISYRREDSEGFARGLFQSLVNYFGKDSVFMDVDSISLGMDFVEAIDKSLDDCGVLLVLIGREWALSNDASGQQRLAKKDDFVRIEIAKALKRKVPVIPVLVKGASMPDSADLPAELQTLTRRQALELRHESWDSDIEHLATALEKILGTQRKSYHPPPVEPPPPGKRPANKGFKSIGAVLAIIIAGVIVYNGVEEWSSSNGPTTIADPVKIDTNTKKGQSDMESYHQQQPSTMSLTGTWIDNQGTQVKMVQQGNYGVSQSIDPGSGALVQANWQINGYQVQFSWAAATGNNGYGSGTISTDYNTITYNYVDQVTGLQSYGQMQRAGR